MYQLLICSSLAGLEYSCVGPPQGLPARNTSITGSQIRFRVLILTFKALNDLGLVCLWNHLLYSSRRALCLEGKNLLVASRVKDIVLTSARSRVYSALALSGGTLCWMISRQRCSFRHLVEETVVKRSGTLPLIFHATLSFWHCTGRGRILELTGAIWNC